MQMARLLALALLALGASAARRSSASESLSQARAWLRSHGPIPQQDELSELKGVNPEAYAIVKALLTKRALGLLDPKHPTASFAPGRAEAAAPAAPHMSSVDFAASVGVTKASSDAAPAAADDEPEMPPPVHHAHKDWLNWRPADSAADDEVVATASQPRDSSGADAVVASSQQAAAAAPPEAPVAKPAALASENTYLKGIDFGTPAQQAAEEAPKAQDNSYLKGLDLGAAKQEPEPAEPAPSTNKQGLVGVKQTVSQDSDSHDYLKDFSWFDLKTPPKRSDDANPLPPARIVSQDEALPAARILTPFGGHSEAPAAQGAAPAAAAPQQKQNALVSWLGSSWGPVKAKPAEKQPSSLAQAPSHRGAGRYSQYLQGLTGL